MIIKIIIILVLNNNLNKIIFILKIVFATTYESQRDGFRCRALILSSSDLGHFMQNRHSILAASVSGF